MRINEDFRLSQELPLKVARAKEAERRSSARFKTFQGHAAGAGKTCAMLEATHQRKAEGLEVVAACMGTRSSAGPSLVRSTR